MSWKTFIASTLLLTSLHMSPAFAQTSDKADGQTITRAARFEYGDFSARFGQRLEALHKKLALSADQEKAWTSLMEKQNALRKGLLEQAGSMRDKAESSTLPQRLALVDEFSAKRQQERAAFNKDLLSFYETLTPEQKTVMDQQWMDGGRKSGERRGRARGDDRRGPRSESERPFRGPAQP